MMMALIKQYRGRVVDSPGDNMLAEFASVLQAVNCAVEIQRELVERNAELPQDRSMAYRIEINLGEVAQEGDRIYGDGVNIAARLESIAEPGGICISGHVYSHVKNKIKLDYEFLGKQTVKNISEPVPVYCIKSQPTTNFNSKFTADKEPISNLSGKPSIAVLPFVNMSHDPEQEYFSDGLSEEIIGALAKLSEISMEGDWNYYQQDRQELLNDNPGRYPKNHIHFSALLKPIKWIDNAYCLFQLEW